MPEVENLVKKATLLDYYDKYDRISIIKINDSNKVLYGAEYKIETYYGKTIPGKLRTNSSGASIYILDSDFFSSYENAISILPDSFKNELNGYTSYNDFINGSLYEKYHFESGNPTKEIDFYIPIKVMETKAPAGYKKLDMTSFLRFNVVYRSDGTLTAEISHSGGMPVFYNHINFDYTNLDHYKYNYVNSFNNTTTSDLLKRKCGEEIISGPAEFNDNYCSDYAYYFVNDEGEVKLVIEDTVNGVKKYDATTDKKLVYKIEVTNTGNAGSGNNEIVTHVPDEVEVLANTISDGGIYSKDEHTITWNIDFIDEGETVDLEYQATAPGEVKGDQLVGYSEVGSDQVKTSIKSTDTIVLMTKSSESVNPNTARDMMLSYTEVVGLMVLLVCLVLYAVYYKNKHKLKRHI
jgi:hypothetical protein